MARHRRMYRMIILHLLIRYSTGMHSGCFSCGCPNQMPWLSFCVKSHGVTRPSRDVLRSYGRIESVHAYGNPATFSWAPPEVKAGWEAAGQAARAEATTLRCEMCGNRFPSEAKLQKHFKMLHERQFNKMKAHK